MKNLTSHTWIRIAFLLLLASFMLPMKAHSQNIDLDAPIDTVEFNFTVDESPPASSPIEFDVDNAEGDDVRWRFNETCELGVPGDLNAGVPSGAAPTMSGDIVTSFTIYGITVTLPSGSPSPVGDDVPVTIEGPATETGSFTFHLSVEKDDESECTVRQHDISIIRKPLDLAVILDRSGSMGWAFDGSFSPDPGERRWDALLTGVSVLADTLGDAVLLEEDLLGLRMFANNVIIPNSPFDGGLVNMESNLDQLTTVLDTVTPSSTTALGDGIIAGRDMLLADSPDHNKAMIVFSDGEQNTGDEVETTGPEAYTQTESGDILAGTDNNINIYTISLGSSGHNPMLMEHIANENNGAYLNTGTIPSPQSENDFKTLFRAHINNILSGSSPQFIDILDGVFPARDVVLEDDSLGYSAIEQTFSVNKDVNSLLVTLLAPTRQGPHFTSIEKDGIELIQYARQNRGNGFVSFALEYPFFKDDETTLAGEWTVEARLRTIPPENVHYTMMVTVDDHLTKPVYSLRNRPYNVGDLLRLSVSLTRMGETIEDAQVQAIVLKPGEDINDLIARADVDFSIDDNDPNTPDVSKLTTLLEDPNFVDQITPEDQFIDLDYDATEGVYEASFDGLDVAGVYQVIFTISAENEEYGKIDRYHKESLYVRFADVDLANSDMSVIVNQEDIPEIHFRPIAGNGKLIGSGWGAAMSLDTDNAAIQNVFDNGDGSYRLVVDGELRGTGALTIAGEPVFEGNLGHLQMCYGPDANIIQRIQCWLLSIGLPAWMIWVVILLILILIWLLFRKKN